MGNFKNTIDVLGHDTVLDSLIDGSITEFKDEYLTEIGNFSFVSRGSLKTVDLLSVVKIGQQAFMNCTNLDTMILRSPLKNTPGASWLVNTAIIKGNGYIYVPASEVERFKSFAYVEDALDNQVRALEDYTVDGTIMGELDESKI